jgi:predicted phage terminase large subunit-like protein
MEDRASGQQLLQDLRRESWLPLLAAQPKADKVTRMAAVSALIESGRLLLPRQAPWLADFEAEILFFPSARHDDQADALSQYLDWLRSHVVVTPRLRNL